MPYLFNSFSCLQISQYELNLKNLDQEYFEIPYIDYPCIFRMPSMVFYRICLDLAQFGDAMVITCLDEG